MRTTPPDENLDYDAFVNQLQSIATITHIPKLVKSAPDKPARWRRIAVHPYASKSLALKARKQKTIPGKGRLYRGVMLDSPLGGEIHEGYNIHRAIALTMRYNNRSAHWEQTAPNEWRRKGRNLMAKVILPALSAQASGKIGDVVFMRRGGQNIARMRVKPSNPNSAGQQLTRGNLSGLATAWRFAGQTGSVTLTRAPSTPQTFNYLTLAEKATWASFQSFIGTNVRRLANGDAAIREGS